MRLLQKFYIFPRWFSFFLDLLLKKSYIRKMKYIKTSTKTVDQIALELETVVPAKGFGLLHVHNLKATMNAKGVDFQPECRVFEVCNPHKANQVLSQDIHLNMVLPCRISVWEEDQQVKIGTLLPTKLLGMLSEAQELQAPAQEVEAILCDIIDQLV